MNKQTEFENAAVRLVSCTHPRTGRIALNYGAAFAVCELCGATTRDEGRTWRAPVLTRVLSDITAAVGVERIRGHANERSFQVSFQKLGEGDYDGLIDGKTQHAYRNTAEGAMRSAVAGKLRDLAQKSAYGGEKIEHVTFVWPSERVGA